MNKSEIQEIELVELEVIINNKIVDYINKYMHEPKYLKVPLWIFNCMKQIYKESMFMKKGE